MEFTIKPNKINKTYRITMTLKLPDADTTVFIDPEMLKEIVEKATEYENKGFEIDPTGYGKI